MAAFSALYDFILPYVPGCETPIVDVAIRRVLRDFYKRTTLWRQTFNTVTVQDQLLYQLVPAGNGSVASILSVEVDGHRIDPLPEHKRAAPAALAAQDRTTPTGWYSTYPSLLTLNPKPTGNLALVIEAAITQPLNSAITTFADDTLAEFGEEIGSGVVGLMMAMPGKPWTQQKASGDFAGKYVRCVAGARARLRDGGQPNASSLTAPRFGR